MFHKLVGLGLLMFVAISSGSISAQENSTPLPAPTPSVVSPPRMVVIPLGNMYYRQNRYDVWQNYGVDSQGYFRPLVVHLPHGSYYYYNGQPYPWFTVHPRAVMPRVQD